MTPVFAKMIYNGDDIAEKPYAISRFLAKILPVPISLNVPISPNLFEIYISKYFLSVMNDVTEFANIA